ncbi:tripartite tricarboxylate transporter substrate binding protein [Micrococcus cohnii]|uniref:Putative tricarboxylic transport membrane protein n=1 Tax=Micrococcus cohnii TaxID=993416 RepID=A0A7W7GQ87_9MICC|nr:tripartite tricarboxylate transporter substrate binding protein [Micrococcus cohnii]MBB4736299.1 putative tricarboxylic transport membrane protein [Micrococcus cohnii]
MPATSPRERPRRGGLGRIIFSVMAVVTIVAACAFSIASASGGNDIRTNLTLIAPAAPGGGWDSFQREMQQSIRSHQLVNNVQVVNIPGAGGTIGLGQLTTLEEANNLMVGGTGQIAAQAAYGSGPELDDVTPVARVVEEYSLVVVPADSEYETLDDLVEAWREDPKGIAWTGGGSFDQLVMADLAMKADIPVDDTTYIPSDGGGEAIQALLNGSAQATAGGVADIYPQVESGRLRALGVVSEKRLEGMDIPTVKEQGYDVTLTNWRALFAPPGVSDEDRAELEKLVGEAVATPEWKDAVKRNHWSAVPLEGEELEQYIRDEKQRIGELTEQIQ